ncbi:MAG: hypothetical protein IKG98_01980 [Ruminococcus sp.]|nr:hypothetical protein [Ruminococcus sp.]MBR3666268.1 hypothetical protein [Ruminococcus sp.]
MSRVKQFFDRRKTDYDFKTVTAALGSLFVTALFALYNGFLGVYHASLWHGSICVYYLVLVGLRTMIIAARKSADRRTEPERANESLCRVGGAASVFERLPRRSRIAYGRSAKARRHDADPCDRDGSVYDV